MLIEIVPADSQTELSALVDLDRQIFSAADVFHPDWWKDYESFWIMADGRRIGAIAFALNTTIAPGEDDMAPGSLYVVSTGMLPEFRGLGIGDIAKEWQITYAKTHGYQRMITNCRRSNAAVIRLNTKWGFEITREIPKYYKDPVEPAIVLERAVT